MHPILARQKKDKAQKIRKIQTLDKTARYRLLDDVNCHAISTASAILIPLIGATKSWAFYCTDF